MLDVIEEEGLCERADRLGAALKARLEAIRPQMPELADIRGPGFMVAAEFIGPDGPDAGLTARVREQALARGLLLLTCGVHGNVIRFLAPLTIPNDQFAQALDILEEAMLAARA